MTKQTQAEEDNRAQSEEEKLKKRGFTLRGQESVVMVVRPSRALSLGKYLYTLGLYGIWRKRHVYVLTENRLMTGRGLINRTETSIPMTRIEDAVFVRRGAGSHCQIVYTAHGRRRVELVGPLLAKDARRLAGEIQARI
jgi:membrane protein YdbS with pleckstrin-like domain